MFPMSIISGIIEPDTNWPRKLASYSSSLCWSKTCAASCWRPNAFTRAWPVNISSMCPLSRAVVPHCLTNWGLARLVTNRVTSTDSGIVTRAMSASSQEIQNITTSTPMTVRSETTSWLMVCWRFCDRLSMSLVTVDSTSPLDRPSKNDSGSRDSLACTCWRSRNIARWTIVAVSRPWAMPSTSATR